MNRLIARIAVLCAVLATAAAASAAGTTLPLPAVSRVVADHAHARIFITGGRTASSIVVANESGAIVKVIGGELGASGMALSGSTLYVARCGQASIDVFDTATLARTESFAAPGLSGSCDIGLAGGRIWYGSDAQWGKLTSVGVDATHTVTDTGITIYGGGMYATTPAVPSLLVASDFGSSPPTFTVYDVSGPTPVVKVSKWMADSGDPDDMVLSADGGTLYVAAGAPYEGRAYAVTDLSQRHAYPTGPYPTSIAVSPNGSVVAVGRQNTPDVHVYAADGSRAIGTVTAQADGNPDIAARSLAFAGDGRRVLGVVRQHYDAHLVLRVFNAFVIAPPPLAVRTSASLVASGATVRVTAVLGHWAVGRSVAITAAPAGAATRQVAAGRVGADGTFTATVRVATRTVFAAAFAGDDVYAAAASPGRAVRARAVVTIRMSGGYRTVRGVRLFHYARGCWTAYRGCPSFTETLRGVGAGRPLRFQIQIRRGTRWVALRAATFRTDPSGRVAVIWRYTGRAWIGHRFRVRVVYAGAPDLLGSASRYVTFSITR